MPDREQARQPGRREDHGRRDLHGRRAEGPRRRGDRRRRDFDVVLGKGYGPLYIGEKRVLKVGADSNPTTVNVRVVDVTQLPYATVAAEAKIDGAALSAFFTSAQGSDSKYTITGKALTGAELAVPTAG